MFVAGVAENYQLCHVSEQRISQLEKKKNPPGKMENGKLTSGIGSNSAFANSAAGILTSVKIAKRARIEA